MNYKKRSAQNLLGILNDLKRRPEDAAADLKIPVDELNYYLSGEKEIPAELIRRAAGIWPVNERDFYCVNDDCPIGVKIMRAKESAKTSRVMKRAGQPYYEYRDTVASTVGQFRPEWIKELCIVDNNSANHQAVQWNNGHFLHQFTYFIGPVNFYYKGERGDKKVAVMNTGDSMYITPFVPHTFATRKNRAGEKGLILALTYGNKLAGETQQELSAIGPELAADYALDFSTREKAAASLLRFHREAAGIDHPELTRRTGLSLSLLEKYELGTVLPKPDDLEALAEALNIDRRELLPPDDIQKKVLVNYYRTNRRWDFPSIDPAYKLVELARTSHLSHSRALELKVLKQSDKNRDILDLKVGLHQYVYNVGNSPVNINWRTDDHEYCESIMPNDSMYVKPFVPHNFRGPDGKLLVLRIGGRVAGEPQRELSLIGKQNSARAFGEMIPWFNQEGRNKV
ncbi:helix-turn-helix domain-containing protein [Candidatus Woesearchaeota archaeon]|nr:helix-turn-helix domain-containing protein [Candidatus Woesearchaeota archaeon]